MKAAMAELKGKADGKLINQAVTKYLKEQYEICPKGHKRETERIEEKE